MTRILLYRWALRVAWKSPLHVCWLRKDPGPRRAPGGSLFLSVSCFLTSCSEPFVWGRFWLAILVPVDTTIACLACDLEHIFCFCRARSSTVSYEIYHLPKFFIARRARFRSPHARLQVTPTMRFPFLPRALLFSHIGGTTSTVLGATISWCLSRATLNCRRSITTLPRA